MTPPGNVESALNDMYDYVWNGYDMNIRRLRNYYVKAHPCQAEIALQEAWTNKRCDAGHGSIAELRGIIQ